MSEERWEELDAIVAISAEDVRAGVRDFVERVADRAFRAEGRSVVRIVVYGGERHATCSHEHIYIRAEDELFHEQRGCLDCDRWLEPLRMKEDKR